MLASDSVDEVSLAPRSGELLGLRRVRVGDHRIVYELLDDALVVLVVRIAYRRDIYRRP